MFRLIHLSVVMLFEPYFLPVCWLSNRDECVCCSQFVEFNRYSLLSCIAMPEVLNSLKKSIQVECHTADYTWNRVCFSWVDVCYRRMRSATGIFYFKNAQNRDLAWCKFCYILCVSSDYRRDRDDWQRRLGVDPHHWLLSSLASWSFLRLFMLKCRLSTSCNRCTMR